MLFIKCLTVDDYYSKLFLEMLNGNVKEGYL